MCIYYSSHICVVFIWRWTYATNRLCAHVVFPGDLEDSFPRPVVSRRCNTYVVRFFALIGSIACYRFRMKYSVVPGPLSPEHMTSHVDSSSKHRVLPVWVRACGISALRVRRSSDRTGFAYVVPVHHQYQTLLNFDGSTALGFTRD